MNLLKRNLYSQQEKEWLYQKKYLKISILKINQELTKAVKIQYEKIINRETN